MNTAPADLQASDISAALRAGWGVAARSLAYAAVGFGSHHYTAEADGERYFLSVDDLERKPWLGAEVGAALEGLSRAFEVAAALRDVAGLGFIVAPIRGGDGSLVHRVGRRYAVAVFRHMPGRAGGFGDAIVGDDRTQLFRMLAALHCATPTVATMAATRSLDIPERRELEAAMRDRARPWADGPLGEPARVALARGADRVAAWLTEFDRLAVLVAGRGRPHVVTHGEPHAGNVLRHGGRAWLIDWDTVALAVPERDLWLMDDGAPDGFAVYEQAAGASVDRDAVRLYRLAWKLTDIADAVAQFHGEHARNADTELSLRALTETLAGR